jgi:AAA15 family ATPase/GTPase
MLIEFQVENFRSFRERQTFSMVAGAFPEHLENNTFEPPLKNFARLLRSAAIYGANAAGKTNLLRAIQFMKALVTQSASTVAPNPYTPFRLSQKTRGAPSCFQIAIAHNGARYEYSFSLSPERVESEWLIEYRSASARSKGREIFNRSWNKKKKDYDWKYSPTFKGERASWSKSTRPEALFLSTAVQFNSEELRPIFEWFQKRLIVIVDEISLNESLTVSLCEKSGGKESLIPFLREADLGISDFSVERKQMPPGGIVLHTKPVMIAQRDPTAALEVVTVTTAHMADNKELVGFNFDDESSGTQILFKTAGAWLNALSNSEVLLIDEIDRSLHPVLAKFLIGKFHTSKANPKNAQLICTTHNTTFMEQDLFRRDQIWFAEKDQFGASKLYPLTDFSPRNDEVLERWYMRGRYGALPNLPSDAD